MTDKPTAAKEPPWQATLDRIDAAKVEELYFPDAPTPIAAKIWLLRQFEESLAKVKAEKK